MQKIASALCILIISAPMWAWAADNTEGYVEQIIVDRSTRSKVLSDYTHLTRDLIERAWTTPTQLSAQGALKGRVSVNYTVKRNGSLESVELVRGSGNADMDRTLLRAIRNAGPFPQFPDEIPAGKLLIRANFIVADVPTLPVTTVEHETDRKPMPEQASEPSEKKYIWGVPAGSAHRMQPPPTEEMQVPPQPMKKYRWGLEQ
jgi:TonB family protein